MGTQFRAICPHYNKRTERVEQTRYERDESGNVTFCETVETYSYKPLSCPGRGCGCWDSQRNACAYRGGE